MATTDKAVIALHADEFEILETSLILYSEYLAAKGLPNSERADAMRRICKNKAYNLRRTRQAYTSFGQLNDLMHRSGKQIHRTSNL